MINPVSALSTHCGVPVDLREANPILRVLPDASVWKGWTSWALRPPFIGQPFLSAYFMCVVGGKNISEKTLVPQCEISSILKKTKIIARHPPWSFWSWVHLGAHEELQPMQAKAVSITVLTEGSERRVSSRCRRQQNQEVEFKEVKFREKGTS